MDYVCGPLLLYSQDKTRMLDFLSDVFEFDVDTVLDSVQRGPLNLKLYELDAPVDVPVNFSLNSGIIFSFKVKSEDELKEIISKYNFFLYRKSTTNSLIEKLDLVQNDDKKVLTISDIDQRIWQFVYETRSLPEI